MEQRAFGQGFQHSGSRLGAALTPPLVVFLSAQWGWRWMFGIVGLIGVVVCVLLVRILPGFSSRSQGSECGRTENPGKSGGAETIGKFAVRALARILHSPDLWFLSCMYFCYGWVLWMYLNWYPTYLVEARGYRRSQMGFGASAPVTRRDGNEHLRRLDIGRRLSPVRAR